MLPKEWLHGKRKRTAFNLQDKPIRWIVDDCKKFVEREIRRGNRYDGIVMDPPSYGRGPGGEVWKLEDSIYDLVELCAQVLSDDPLFFLLNSYTTGLSPSVMEYILGVTVGKQHKGKGILVRDRTSGQPERLCASVRQYRNLGKIKQKNTVFLAGGTVFFCDILKNCKQE